MPNQIGACHARPPTWQDARNPDWERATLRELPVLDPPWAPESAADRRIEHYLTALVVLATPLLAWQLWVR